VIVVIGDVAGCANESGIVVPAGFAATVATVAAAGGSKVELVTRVGEDATGDAVILALARAGVGHVATLRDPGRGTPLISTSVDDAEADVDDDPPTKAVDPPSGPVIEPADIGLALRYLSDYRVIVVAHARDRAVLDEAVEAAGWSGGHLVVITSPGLEGDLAVPEEVIAVAAEPDAEGVAARVGRYATAIDAGDDRGTAYAALTGANAES
jgi:sugar/nucleoside kinase (ribokinase family)